MRLLCLAAVVVALLSPASLQSGAPAPSTLPGIWVGQAPGRNGELQDVAFRFVQRGSELSGKMYGDTESLAVVDLRIEGDRITFSVRNDFGGNRSRVVYEGTLKDGEMQLTRRREPPPATPPTAPATEPQRITLKRL